MSVIMEEYWSVIMEVFRDRFIASELLPYKEVLFEGEWYAQRDPDEVDWVECNCIHLAEQLGHLMEVYRERFFTYVLLQSSTRSLATQGTSCTNTIHHSWIIYMII